MKEKRLLVALTIGLAMVLAMTSIAAAKEPSVDPSNFVKEVNNKFFPLKPGTTFFYLGMKDGIPARNETYVTVRYLECRLRPQNKPANSRVFIETIHRKHCCRSADPFRRRTQPSDRALGLWLALPRPRATSAIPGRGRSR